MVEIKCKEIFLNGFKCSIRKILKTYERYKMPALQKSVQS